MRIFVLVFMLLAPAIAVAAERESFTIGYLEIAGDPR